MADNKKVQEEENFKKLEDQAYFELCQIIAEAIELQDVDLLNARIASWKNKYKKLLDRPSTNAKSDFKKRIEYLLTQYYSEVTKYILSQLKLHEEKKVENQAKALRELYTIIRNTNDYDLLKSKVNKWKEKYPVSGFISMYQKRIELYTRDKNLRENAFKQEEAFSDLIDITKVHGTLDELKNELTLWEEKYSINDKYSIDDFLKHQTEVNRYTSDEFLQSIAREEHKTDNIDKSEIDIVEEFNNNSFSDLSIQASAYSKLLKISKSSNAINEMFTWVYKNRNIKFNDKYKELILSATYLEYSPKYLNKIQKPELDMTKKSLSYEEFKNINDIKKFAILSYFNLLLPPDKAISNDYFTKNIKTIYAKSEKARVSNFKEDSLSLDYGIEISLKRPDKDITYNVTEIDSEPNGIESDEIVENTSKPIETEIIIPSNNEVVILPKDSEESPIEEDIDKSLELGISNEEIKSDTLKFENDNETEIVANLSSTESELTINLNSPEKEEISNIKNIPQEIDSDEKSDSQKELDYTTIVAISPLFFEAINNYDKQSVLINHIDSATTKFVESEKSKEATLDQYTKTKIDED